MSIPSNSVLRRILEEVLAGPVPDGLAASRHADGAGERIELWRSPFAHRSPYATSLHFWAHALRAFLGSHGRPDAFGSLAGHCLCEAAPGTAVAEAFARLGARFDPPFALAPEGTEPAGAYRTGYRMVDQVELVSWVAERADEFAVVFWLRPAWLEGAQPLPLEPIEYVEPE